MEFWRFIEELKSLQEHSIDVARFHILKKYNVAYINSMKTEFWNVYESINTSYDSLFNDKLLSEDNYDHRTLFINSVIFSGKNNVDAFFEDSFSFINNFNFKNLNSKLENFHLIFEEIEQGEGYPILEDKDNLFFALSLISTDVLVKMLQTSPKQLIINELKNKSTYSDSEIENILKGAKIGQF